jgi:hypothetical protein
MSDPWERAWHRLASWAKGQGRHSMEELPEEDLPPEVEARVLALWRSQTRMDWERLLDLWGRSILVGALASVLVLGILWRQGLFWQGEENFLDFEDSDIPAETGDIGLPEGAYLPLTGKKELLGSAREGRGRVFLGNASKEGLRV